MNERVRRTINGWINLRPPSGPTAIAILSVVVAGVVGATKFDDRLGRLEVETASRTPLVARFLSLEQTMEEEQRRIDRLEAVFAPTIATISQIQERLARIEERTSAQLSLLQAIERQLERRNPAQVVPR